MVSSHAKQYIGEAESARTGGYEALGDVEGFDALKRVAPASLVVARDLGGGDGDVELALCEAVQLLQHEVKDIQPGGVLYQARDVDSEGVG